MIEVLNADHVEVVHIGKEIARHCTKFKQFGVLRSLCTPHFVFGMLNAPHGIMGQILCDRKRCQMRWSRLR